MHFKKCINTILKRSYGGREDISLVVQGVVRIFCSFTWYMWPKDWLMLTLHTLFKESSRQDIKQAKATQTRYKAYRNERENERESFGWSHTASFLGDGRQSNGCEDKRAPRTRLKCSWWSTKKDVFNGCEISRDKLGYITSLFFFLSFPLSSARKWFTFMFTSIFI